MSMMKETSTSKEQFMPLVTLHQIKRGELVDVTWKNSAKITLGVFYSHKLEKWLETVPNVTYEV